jgi:hypothetical protein
LSSQAASIATPVPATIPIQQVQLPSPGTGNNDAANKQLTQNQSAGTAYCDIMSKTDDTNAICINGVRNFVTLELFPHVKFITRKSKLDFFDHATCYPNTYCAVVTKGYILVPHGMKPIVWWETIARKEVKKKVSKLRSDKLTASLKWVYIGKLAWATCVLFYNSVLTQVFNLVYRKKNVEVWYTLDNWLEMHRNYAAYSVFYKTFLPEVVGECLFAYRIHNRPD